MNGNYRRHHSYLLPAASTNPKQQQQQQLADDFNGLPTADPTAQLPPTNYRIFPQAQVPRQTNGMRQPQQQFEGLASAEDRARQQQVRRVQQPNHSHLSSANYTRSSSNNNNNNNNINSICSKPAERSASHHAQAAPPRRVADDQREIQLRQDQYANQLRSRTSTHFQMQHNQQQHHSQPQPPRPQHALAVASSSLAPARGHAHSPLHVNFGRSGQSAGAAATGDEEEAGEGRKKKYLTAKYGQQQMNLIKKRLKIEMWLHEQLQALAKGSEAEDELDEIDVDLDQLLDMDDDATRLRWLKKTLAPFQGVSGERLDKFISEVLEQSKLL